PASAAAAGRPRRDARAGGAWRTRARPSPARSDARGPGARRSGPRTPPASPSRARSRRRSEPPPPGARGPARPRPSRPPAGRRRGRAHGGSWMARRAVEALVEEGDQEASSGEALVERLLNAGRELAASRPGVGAVAGAVGRVLAAAQREHHLPVDQLRQLVRAEAESLLDGRRRAGASIAVHLKERLANAVVLTHSASATVREALLYTPPERVICTVSSPQEEGRAFADELRREGLEVTLVEDDQAQKELEWASLFLIGADTVFRDGTLCNK